MNLNSSFVAIEVEITTHESEAQVGYGFQKH